MALSERLKKISKQVRAGNFDIKPQSVSTTGDSDGIESKAFSGVAIVYDSKRNSEIARIPVLEFNEEIYNS